MSDAVLTILKLVFLAGLYLFFFRVLRSVWAESTATAVGGAGGVQPTAAARARILAPAESKGIVFDLGDETTVGRGANCGVPLKDSTVSQLHARFFRQNGKLYVEDLGSTNGTFVNRKAAKRPTPVRRGDRVQVGQTIMELTR